MSNRPSLLRPAKSRSGVMAGMKLCTITHRPKKGPGSYKRTARAVIVGW